ncbi:hypothetical protein BGX34_001899 [Mortierella sp. NVP85]|nr:hypothetical protein BGX34_001899 [Mortierella sp. NVP85]
MSRSNMQRGWFWLTEWVIDKTDPNVDSEGWQYGKSLVESNQQWTAIPPTSGGNWVRRRKWIRVMKKRLDLITSPGDTAENIEDGQPSFGQEMAGNYTKRANLALRLNDGFTDKVQELQRYSQAIQILLYGIKVDMDPSTKQTASVLVTQYLQRAEELKDAIRQREAAYEYFHRLDMPRLQAGDADGSGSGSELLTLNLQKSRPYDLETTNDLLHSQHENDDDPDDHSECVSESSFSSALDGDGQDQAQDNESRTTLDQHRSTDDDVELLLSELTTQDGDSPSVDADDHGSTLTQPIPVSNHQVPTVAVLSASPAAGQSDSFPVARLTRIPRSEISPSSSSRSNADPISSSPSMVSSGFSRRAEYSSMATRASGSSSPTSARHPSSFYSPPGRINQDRTTFGIRPTQSSVQPQPPTVTEAKWELDHKAIECRECHRKFSLWLRRHHCRRCGHVVCDRCSSQRAMLPPDRVVFDPTSSEAYLNHQALLRKGTIQSYRVCDSCYATLEPIRSHSMSGASGNGSGSNSMYSSSGTLPQAHRPIYGQTSSHSVSQASSAPVQSDRSMGMFAQGSAYSQNQQSHTSSRSSSSSNLHPAPMVRSASSGSLMSECPVCGIILAGLEGGKTAQETHVQDCLEGKSGNGAGPPVRYIMYKLAADSPLIDQECAICFEEFVAGEFP